MNLPLAVQNSLWIKTHERASGEQQRGANQQGPRIGESDRGLKLAIPRLVQ